VGARFGFGAGDMLLFCVVALDFGFFFHLQFCLHTGCAAEISEGHLRADIQACAMQRSNVLGNR
jgi:hypothetical protein